MSAMTEQTERSNESRITVLETRFDDAVPTLATKRDLAESERRVRSDLAEVDKRLSMALAEQKGGWEAILPTLATKAGLERLRADMERQFAGLIKWMIAMLITMVFGFGSMLLTIIALMKQS